VGEAPKRRQTILLIEDEPDIVMGLSDALEFEGFRALCARTGAAGIDLTRSERPDCILLDLMLPDINGYHVCEAIRAHDPRVPLIMLTAKSQETDKIRGLEAGADDYVTKPFSIGELLARIRAIFRRIGRSVPALDEAFTIGAARVNPQKQLLVRHRQELVLTFYENELLKLLWERRGEPVSRDEILDKIWGVEAFPTNRTVDNFVAKLRKKIEANPAEPRHILTVYGTGYKLVP
jgi:DNA-binding response OmpR family regulator